MGVGSRLRIIAMMMLLGLPLIACSVLTAAPTAIPMQSTRTSGLPARGSSAISTPPTVTTALPSTAPAASTNFDGLWWGTAIPAQGVKIGIVFTVRDSTITNVVWDRPQCDGTRNTNMVYSPISNLPFPRITQNKFSVELGTDLSLSLTFDSTTSARGYMKIHWVDSPDCKGSFEGTWMASKFGGGTPVLVKNYQISFVDACSARSSHTQPYDIVAMNGYLLLFVYLTIQDKDQSSLVTPSLPKTSFFIADVNGRNYGALRSSVAGACDPEDPAHQCTHYGEPFNEVVLFVVPEGLINQPWEFLFKGAKAFKFSLGPNFICPYKDRRAW